MKPAYIDLAPWYLPWHTLQLSGSQGFKQLQVEDIVGGNPESSKKQYQFALTGNIYKALIIVLVVISNLEMI